MPAPEEQDVDVRLGRVKMRMQLDSAMDIYNLLLNTLHLMPPDLISLRQLPRKIGHLVSDHRLVEVIESSVDNFGPSSGRPIPTSLRASCR